MQKGYNDHFSVNGTKKVLDEGHWTFDELRDNMEENGLPVKDYSDGKIKIDFAKRRKTAKLWNLTGVFGMARNLGQSAVPFAGAKNVPRMCVTTGGKFVCACATICAV
jgi:hypothetical protein